MSEFKKETQLTLTRFFSLKHRTMSLTLMIDQELKRGCHLYKVNNAANVHLNTISYKFWTTFAQIAQVFL